MFNKLLVALDHSPMADRVMAKAMAIGQANQAELLLLHVLSGEEEDSPLPIPPGAEEIYWAPGTGFNLDIWRKQWETYEQECLDQLHQRSALAQTAGIATQVKQIAGSPGRSICHQAKVWGADLIVIGHRGRLGLQELILGSVSNYILHHAPCAVLTVKTALDEDSNGKQLPDNHQGARR
ncbi:universal stress protein [Alkalinema pantanalense CENA528]|uniref:universal stress protein n=1 Tax=Alkalinema pantanalense TaxID=1620705 RepID=UPI003D6DBF61